LLRTIGFAITAESWVQAGAPELEAEAAAGPALGQKESLPAKD